MTEQDNLNVQHARNPEVGDYWSEMCNGVLVIVSVLDDFNSVVTCETKKAAGPGYWTWDFSKLNVRSIEGLEAYLRYSAKPDLGFWARVKPRHHLELIAQFKLSKEQLTT